MPQIEIRITGAIESGRQRPPPPVDYRVPERPGPKPKLQEAIERKIETLGDQRRMKPHKYWIRAWNVSSSTYFRAWRAVKLRRERT
jgi:hypothetical protein